VHSLIQASLTICDKSTVRKQQPATVTASSSGSRPSTGTAGRWCVALQTERKDVNTQISEEEVPTLKIFQACGGGASGAEESPWV